MVYHSLQAVSCRATMRPLNILHSIRHRDKEKLAATFTIAHDAYITKHDMCAFSEE